LLAVASLLVIASLSMLITRIGTAALALTGISRELAYFQAFSAFSGVGFTTMESEQVVSHPVRRRILLSLMLAGNVGIVTGISSLILTFVQVGTPTEWASRLFLLVGGFAVLFLVAWSKWVDALLSRIIGWGLNRWTDLQIIDYESLLQISDGYAVLEIVVHEHEWLANKTLSDLNLIQEGVVVLGIKRQDDSYVGSPTKDSSVVPGDTLVLYGRRSLLAELSKRGRGAAGAGAHQQAMADQRIRLKEQTLRDAAHNL
jgi:hypothetical protein